MEPPRPVSKQLLVVQVGDSFSASPATIGNSHGTAVDGTAFTDLGPAQ